MPDYPGGYDEWVADQDDLRGSGGGGGSVLQTKRKITSGVPFDTSGLSPLALSFLQKLFMPNQAYVVEDSANPFAVGTEGTGAIGGTGAKSVTTGGGGAATKTMYAPELMSAQTMKGIKGQGLWDQVMGYLDLMGEGVKESWIAQAMAGMPSENRRNPVQYKTTRQK